MNSDILQALNQEKSFVLALYIVVIRISREARQIFLTPLIQQMEYSREKKYIFKVGTGAWHPHKTENSHICCKEDARSAPKFSLYIQLICDYME